MEETPEQESQDHKYLTAFERMPLAFDAVALGDAHKVLKQDRDVTKWFWQRQGVKQESPMAAQGDDVIVVGDYKNEIHHPPQPSSNLPKLALAAGLIATGIGLPVGAGMIANAILNRPPTVIPDFKETPWQLDIVNPDKDRIGN